MNILTMCGSLRSASLNKAIEATLPELAPDGMSFQSAPSFAEFPLYDADLQGRDGFPDGVRALADAVRHADGVIIVSPEYNYSVPGALKNAIDWVSRVPNQPFKHKPVALQSAAAGALGGSRMQYHLRQVMVFLEATVLAKPEVFVTFGAKKVENGRLVDEASRKAVADQLVGFQDFIDRVR